MSLRRLISWLSASLLAGASLHAQLQPLVWTSTAPTAANAWRENIQGTAFGNGRFVVAGWLSGIETAARIAYSNDLINWTTATLPAGISPAQFGREWFPRSAGFGNGLFLVGGFGAPVANTEKLLSSSDNGVTWTLRDVRLGDVFGLDYLNGLWFATGNSGNSTSNLATSPDGITWTPRATGSSDDLYGVAFGAGLYVAVGNGSQVNTSTDGLNWTRRTVTEPGVSFTDIVYGGGRFMACALGGIIYSSTDGMNWTRTVAVSGGRLYSITHANGRYVTVGDNVSASSLDGQTWLVDTSNLRLARSVTYGAGVFMIGADIGTMYRSGIPISTGPVIATQPQDVSALAGGTATFRVAATGAGLLYQWRRNGVNIPGATSATLVLTGADVVAGSYSVLVRNADGMVISNAATLVLVSPSAAGRLINMSIRTGAGTGDSTLIVGLAIGGANTSGTKAVLLRAVGPTLSGFGVGGALADPVLSVFQGQTQVAQNDDWAGGFDFGAVGAFAFSGASPRDSGYYNPAVASGSYSIQITGKNNGTGVALAEIYDATPSGSFSGATPRLVNVSARTIVGTGDNILIAGFVVGGSAPVRVLIRAIGPTLAAFGVGSVLVDPRLEVFSGPNRLAENDNWGGAAELKAAFDSVGAFPLANDSSRDAAVVTTLQPGSYTAQISGVANASGVALVEVYELP